MSNSPNESSDKSLSPDSLRMLAEFFAVFGKRWTTVDVGKMSLDQLTTMLLEWTSKESRTLRLLQSFMEMDDKPIMDQGGKNLD